MTLSCASASVRFRPGLRRVPPRDGSGTPLFAEGFEIGFGEIFGRHGRVEFHFGVEGEEPGLGEGRYFGHVVHLDDQGSAAADVTRAEISRLGLEGLQDLLHLWPPSQAVPIESTTGSIIVLERQMSCCVAFS